MSRAFGLAIAAAAMTMAGCQTVGTAADSTGHAVGETAEKAADATSAAARGAAHIISNTARAADREMHDDD
jgi:hypothetical protein